MESQSDDHQTEIKFKEQAPDNEALSSLTAKRSWDLEFKQAQHTAKVSGWLKMALFVFACFMLCVTAVFIIFYGIYFVSASSRVKLFGDEIEYAKEIFQSIMALIMGGVLGVFVSKFIQ